MSAACRQCTTPRGPPAAWVLQTARLDCANMEAASSGSKHFEPSPVCTGEFQTLGPTGTCVCIDGYRDKPCTPYIGDCTDAYNRGLYNDTMVVEVYPLLAQQPFRVNCKMKSNVRTYIMDHNSDALLNFNRSFNVITSWGSETCPPTIGWGWRRFTS
ncbi:uncharacterized protein LOC112567022 [Pomacea canaliculata]|uniref:uncharacterized protein LOC112567022 n=1 Tax=Pomacea canaliculata TaxID=400727 RepID=UPI000D72D65E|nr:uncharacterized protein LOC112567022 [Pomacea canaliculata]